MKITKNLRSSFIKKVIYEETKKEMTLYFVNVEIKVYKYYDVSKRMFVNFCSAKSVGAFFAEKIRNKKQFRKLKTIQF